MFVLGASKAAKMRRSVHFSSPLTFSFVLIALCVLVSHQVSATFAASLVTSPAIGAYLSAQYDDSLVVLVATVIAVADIAFVFFVVPESLPDKMRLTSWGFPISWEQADPFAVSSDTKTPTVLNSQCVPDVSRLID